VLCTVRFITVNIYSKLLHYVNIIIYFFHFPPLVDVSALECNVAVVEGVLEAEASMKEPEDEALKLNLKREDWKEVDGPVMMDLLLMPTEKYIGNTHLDHLGLMAKG